MGAVPLPEVGNNAAEMIRRLRAIDAEIFGTLYANAGIIGGDVVIEGTTTVTDIISSTWDGVDPLSLPDGTATLGYALDDSAGVGQFTALYAPGANITDLPTTNLTGTISEAQIEALAVTEAKVAASAITTAKIAADAVEAGNIADLAVGEEHVQALAISEGKVAAGAITVDKVGALAIETGKLALDAVTAAQLADLAVGGEHVQALAITAGKIAANTITAAQIQANTITAAEILANTITATEILAGSITATEIDANTITAANIAAGTITATEIFGNTITASEIAALTITSAEIAAGAIVAGKIDALSITAGDIAAGAITAGKILVDDLAAIHADMGTLNVNGPLTLGGTGSIFASDYGDPGDGNSALGLDDEGVLLKRGGNITLTDMIMWFNGITYHDSTSGTPAQQGTILGLNIVGNGLLPWANDTADPNIADLATSFSYVDGQATKLGTVDEEGWWFGGANVMVAESLKAKGGLRLDKASGDAVFHVKAQGGVTGDYSGMMMGEDGGWETFIGSEIDVWWLGLWSSGLSADPLWGWTSTYMRGPDGTAALPSYSWHSDPNTGMYRLDENIIGFATGGVEKMRIDGSYTRVSTGFIPTTQGTKLLGHGSYYWSKLYVNYIEQPGWNAMTLQNSWAWYGSGYQTPQYKKDRQGMVIVEGLVKNGSSASAIIETLPVGYRPNQQVILLQGCNTGQCDLRVDTAGNIYAANNGSTGWITLNFQFYVGE